MLLSITKYTWIGRCFSLEVTSRNDNSLTFICSVVLENYFVDKQEVIDVLESVGFCKTEVSKGASQLMPITSLSGGWKMKMQLCAATLMNADILMLDEPTGHLDVTNIAWIKKWLKDNVIEVEWEGEKSRLWTPWTKR